MGWKRIIFGIWIIGSLAWANYAILQELLHPTEWENVFFDPWFWIVSVGLPSALLALVLKGVIWAVSRIRHAHRSKRRRRRSRSRHHGELHHERHEPNLTGQSSDEAPPARRHEPNRPRVVPRPHR